MLKKEQITDVRAQTFSASAIFGAFFILKFSEKSFIG